MSTDPKVRETRSLLAAAESLNWRLRKHEQFGSQLLRAKRDFIVYLPPMYDGNPYRRYPVLFMQDGQNLFHPETAFIKRNYWRMGETADELTVAGQVEPLIIVGVYNSGEHRINEYTHLADRRWGGGQADRYGQMIVEELKPFIDHSYRTLPGAENCGIGGSSLGGLVSLYLGLRYPSVFGKIAAISPSVWWHNRAILETVAELPSKPELRIWLDIGTREGRRDVRVLKKHLLRKGWKRGDDLAYTEALGGEHSEWAWALRVAPMLRFLFPPR